MGGLRVDRQFPVTSGLLWRLDAARTDTASTSWCPLCAAARARFRQPAQRSNRATQYHDLQWIRLNFPPERRLSLDRWSLLSHRLSNEGGLNLPCLVE